MFRKIWFEDSLMLLSPTTFINHNWFRWEFWKFSFDWIDWAKAMVCLPSQCWPYEIFRGKKVAMKCFYINLLRDFSKNSFHKKSCFSKKHVAKISWSLSNKSCVKLAPLTSCGAGQGRKLLIEDDDEIHQPILHEQG